MSGHRELARTALSALQVRSSTSYSWCGATTATLSPEVESAMSEDVAREFLLHQLQQELYGNFYCRGFPVSATGQPQHFTPLGSAAFVETLAAANRGRGALQPGWQVHGNSDGQLIVHRDGLSLWVSPAQTLAGEQAEMVSLRLPNELRKASPGFYLALGESPISGEDSGRLLRLYWHLTSGAAPKLLDRLTDLLNREQVPFQLKVIDNPDRYSRCDAGVLYAPRALYAAIQPVIADAYRLLRGELRAATPVFTKQLAPGLGLAEDPGDGQSFGMHRMMLLARAVLRAHEQGRESIEERARILSEVFDEAGLNLDRPYLNPDSGDHYELLRP
jgi:HopA1 effector protein family